MNDISRNSRSPRILKSSYRLLAILLTAFASLAAQNGGLPLTRAESSGYEETSRYQDVVDFLAALEGSGNRIHVDHFGFSLEGRKLPLAVWGDVASSSPEAVRRDDKIRVLVQANIHAGEVCGKEATLILLRQLAQGRQREWADSMVLLAAPIYNADGNERIRLGQRRLQHGPVAGMGQRPNAQGLDLNRDHMKLVSPEARSLIRLMNRYDPHVVIDLHTTNGTAHGYHLTYSPPLHPNTSSAIVELLRASLLPQVSQRVLQEHGTQFYYYGNVPRRGNRERGWYTFDHRPRFNNNYVGLRNRLGILSEAYSYATFENRVKSTLHFLQAILQYVHSNPQQIKEAVKQADSEAIAGRSLALRAVHERSAEPSEILLGEVATERNPYDGSRMLRRTETLKREKMPEFGTFRATESVEAPAAYLIPENLSAVVDLVRHHGVRLKQLDAPRSLQVERFRIDSSSQASNEFQGHRQRELKGAYETIRSEIPAGTWMASTDQPLGRLLFTLLEPRSDDGLVNWNFLDRAIEGRDHYPILRLALQAER